MSWPSQPLAAGSADGRAGAAAVERNATRFIVLICILPLFAQSFYYLLPVAPLYYLSKVWPVLMLPAAAWALTRLQLQSRTVYVIWLAYAIGLTPLISMMQLGAGFFDALTTTVKVWPFTYYFSLLGVLCWLRPTARQIERAVLAEFQAGGIGKIDAKTGKLSFYPTPTPYARARRGRVDAQNRLWFAEFGGNAIGMFDPETEKITEYRNPLQWEAPYDVVADRNGEAWEVNETSDRVGRLDPRTAEITNYLLPRNGNIGRVFVDDRSNPVTVWIGNNLAASIVKIEPLD